MIGETIAHYGIVKKIASGGMSEVFLAEDTRLDRRIAPKTLPPEFAGRSRAPRQGRLATCISRGTKDDGDIWVMDGVNPSSR